MGAPATREGARLTPRTTPQLTPQLTLLTRAYCHLCDTMREALVPLARRHGATIAEFDVDAHPALEAAYGDLVPVLLHGDVDAGVVICHYHLDHQRVEAALQAR